MEGVSKRTMLSFVCSGALIGILAVFSLPTILVLTLSIYVIYKCRAHCVSLEEKKFVVCALTLALAVRIAISVFILTYGRYSGVGSDIFGDAMTYEGVGAYIKELASGVPTKASIWGDNFITVNWLRKFGDIINNSSISGIYSVPIVSHWYGYLNTLWGLSFLAPKILNGLLWIIGAFWLYVFFQERFTIKGDKLGLIITLFLPSSLIFSSSGLKDSLLFFLIVAIIFSSHKLERLGRRRYGIFTLLITALLDRFSSYISISRVSFFLISIFIISFMMVIYNNRHWLSWATLIISSGILLPAIRPYVHSFVLMFAFFILLSKVNLKKIVFFIILAAILGSLVFKGGGLLELHSRLNAQIRDKISESVLQSYNTAYGNTAYHIYPEKYYANIKARDKITFSEVAIAYLNGLRYVFLEPTILSFNSSIAMPMLQEALFMWFFTPFIILGSIIILRINTKTASFTLLFLFIIATLLVLGQGNIGTLIRTRCMIMPWYFMIGALGLNAAYSYLFKLKSKAG